MVLGPLPAVAVPLGRDARLVGIVG
jgi:hypothetical protein